MAVGLPKYRNRTSSCTGTRSRTRFSELSRPRGRLFSTGSLTASCLLIRRMPYSTLPHELLAFGEGASCVRRTETDRVASRPQCGLPQDHEKGWWADYPFSFHDSEEIGPAILAKISKKTGPRSQDL